MLGLDLDHPYYGSQASKFLGVLFSTMEYLEMPITLREVERMLISNKSLNDLISRLEQLNESATELMKERIKILKDVSDKDLAGLTAQIQDRLVLEFIYFVRASQI